MQKFNSQIKCQSLIGTRQILHRKNGKYIGNGVIFNNCYCFWTKTWTFFDAKIAETSKEYDLISCRYLLIRLPTEGDGFEPQLGCLFMHCKITYYREILYMNFITWKLNLSLQISIKSQRRVRCRQQLFLCHPACQLKPN